MEGKRLRVIGGARMLDEHAPLGPRGGGWVRGHEAGLKRKGMDEKSDSQKNPKGLEGFR